MNEILISQIEPELKKKATKAASRTELKRLEVVSELKSAMIDKERALILASETEHQSQTILVVAVALVLLLAVLLIWSQLRQKQKLTEQFKRLSVLDSLTNLGNRRYLESNIEQEIRYVNRKVKVDRTCAIGIFMVDIDHFKIINDTYGHKVGDQVLVMFAKILKNKFRETDLLVRWGGEEFIIVARVKYPEGIKDIANRLLSVFRESVYEVSDRQPIKMTCTVGGVTYPFMQNDNEEPDWRQLVNLADLALLFGKRKGRDCWNIIVNESLSCINEFDNLFKQSLERSLEERRISILSSG